MIKSCLVERHNVTMTVERYKVLRPLVLQLYILKLTKAEPLTITSMYAAALSDGRGGGSHSFGGLLKCSVTNQCSWGQPTPATDKQQINQSINWSTNQSINQSINWSIDQSQYISRQTTNISIQSTGPQRFCLTQPQVTLERNHKLSSH